MQEIKKILPITILITSYNRNGLLKKCVELINSRTFFPYRIIVVDNNSTDGSQGMLREMKVQGKIWDCVLLDENLGQCKSLNEGFKVIEEWENNQGRMHRPSNDFIITSNEDIYPPMLGQDNCWLTQMVDILERNEPEYGGLMMRIQRIPRNDIDENTEITPCYKGFPSVFRLLRRSDIRKLGDNPFGALRKWQGNVTGESYKNQIRKKFGFTTKIYADHAGFLVNSGYEEGIDTFTVAANKVRISEENPYATIDPETNIPISINCHKDGREQTLRENYQKDIRGEHTGPEVTVLVLTCHRLDGLKRVIDSVKTKTKINYRLLVGIDSDDTVSYNYCTDNGIECLLSSNRRDFVKQANMLINICETPFFSILADDTEVITDGWLCKSLEIFKEKFSDNSGLLSFNENIQKGRIFVCGLSSKKFVYDVGGNLYFPMYKHFKGDREITEIAREMDKYHYTEDIKVEHYHPTNPDENKRNKKDDTYNKSNMFLSFDRELYSNRKKSGRVNKNYCDYL